MSDLHLAFAIVQKFTQNATGKRIAEIEGLLKNATRSTSTTLLTEANTISTPNSSRLHSP